MDSNIIYKPGTKLQSIDDANDAWCRTANIITVKLNISHPTCYGFEEQEHEAPWSAPYFNNTDRFKPLLTWKDRYKK